MNTFENYPCFSRLPHALACNSVFSLATLSTTTKWFETIP